MPSDMPPASASGGGVFANLEKRLGGRLGVSLVKFDGSILFGYRSEDRFAMCSTFKTSLAAAILEKVEAGEIDLSEEIAFGEADLVSYRPVIDANLEKGRLSIEELCKAAVQLSDNVAANLLLRKIGGPEALTAFFRLHGDNVTRLDRWETELNENAQGDPRDTTSPLAVSSLMVHLLFGTGLEIEQQATLREWMEGTKTGADKIRAGVPEGWNVGNKTGTGLPTALAVNDTAFLLSPGGKAGFLSIYMDRPTAGMEDVKRTFSNIGRLAARTIEFS